MATPKKLSGVVPPVGTPLTTDDRVDVPGLQRLIAHLLDAHVHGIFLNGTMGGFAFLRDVEQQRLIEVGLEANNGRVPFMAGLGETSSSRAVGRAKEIARAGVDFISLLPPFYYFAQQEHLIAYVSDIAAAVDVPLILYDNPVLTKNRILPETIYELRMRIPQIVGVKESFEDCANLQKLLQLVRDFDGFSVMTGSEFLIHVGLQMGVDGCVGGLHNICPHLAVELYEAFRAGDTETARARQNALVETWQIFTYGKIWGAFDESLRYLGICERATGAPYVTEVTAEERAAIHAILRKHCGPERRLVS